MHGGQREADREAGETGGGDPLGDEQDHQDERSGQQGLEHEGALHVDRAVVVGVGAQRPGLVGDTERADEQLEHRGTGDRPGELGHDVQAGLPAGDPLGQEHAERDGGVDVRARHGPERVGQHQHDQAEGQGHTDGAGGRTGAAISDTTSDAEHRRSDGEEDQEEGADELGNELAGHGGGTPSTGMVCVVAALMAAHEEGRQIISRRCPPRPVRTAAGPRPRRRRAGPGPRAPRGSARPGT